MNKDNAKDYLPLVQALADGKTIQGKNGDAWIDFDSCDELSLLSKASVYRIKPQPREFWVKVDQDGYVKGAFSMGHQPTEGLIKVREVME